MNDPPDDWELKRSSFERMLIEDVLGSRTAFDARPDQSASRNVIRTTFAAIEGLAWRAREQVREISASMG